MMKLIFQLIFKNQQGLENDSRANIEFSKIQLSKIVKLGGFLFGPPCIFGSTTKEIIPLPANLIKNSFVKELRNKDPKKNT